MVHKLALLIGGVGATGVLAVALGFGGFIYAAPVAADVVAPDVASAQALDTTAQAPATEAPAAEIRTVVDTVYVAPTPRPAAVHVTRPGPNHANQPAPAATTPRNTARHADREGNDDPRESDRERGDDGREHGDD